jgi:hypothetical protein
MIDFSKLRRQRLTSLLGLALDGSRLEGVLLRHSDGALQVEESFSVSLSLDPLTAAPELVGREIRNHLDAAEIRERTCVVCLPLKWALTTHVEVPQLSEADAASFLALEAERTFPCDAASLLVCRSICRSGGKQYAMLAGIPRNHLERLEQVLAAARLKPLSFSLGLAQLQSAQSKESDGVLALAIGETHVGLQITCAGGVAALRALDGALELQGARRVLNSELVAREARITLGQLPADLRDGVRRIRVFGPRELGQQLADDLEVRLESMGLKVEWVSHYAPAEFGVALPKETAAAPAVSFAAGQLVGRPVEFEFLPPKVTTWQQLSARYASGKLRTVLTAVAAVLVLVGGLFAWQQWRIWSLQARYARIADKVKHLEVVQKNIQQYRSWSDETVRALTLLRRMTDAFPQTGDVTAKTIEIRDLRTVTCTGTAKSYQALLETIRALREQPERPEVSQGPTRGQAPALQFTFTCIWNDGGSRAN